MAHATHATAAGTDDLVLPFRTISSGVAGWVVRLGPSMDEILGRHSYPLPVSQLLGDAIILTAVLGGYMQQGSRLTLQTSTDGPVRRIVVDLTIPGQIRAHASFDKDAITALESAGGTKPIDQAKLIGAGRMALTIDPGDNRDSYQGIVPLDGEDLRQAAETYFRQSEQIPTFIRIATARVAHGSHWHWRGGALMLQYVPEMSQSAQPETVEEAERGYVRGEDAEDWVRVTTLAGTVGADELTDPRLTPQRLLLRLFHEEGIATFDPTPVKAQCRCSRERVVAMLKSFDASEMADMRTPQGTVAVTCEFCSMMYEISEDLRG